MFRRRPLRKLLFTVRRHRQPLPALPDEVVELIVSFCTRFSLYNSCLASRTLNRLAVPFLYEDPFGLDRPDVTSDTRYNFLAHYQIPRRLAKLCRTIVENPDLAQLVRVFRGVYWRDLSMGSADWEVVLSKLQNITTVSFRAPDTDAFVPPQPPSRIQRVYVDTIAISDWFSRWLTSQGRMQILDLKDASIVYEIPAITLLNLRRLCASHELASFILPHSGRSLAEFKGTAPQTCFAWLLERLREHSPSVRSIAIKVDCSLHFTQTDEEVRASSVMYCRTFFSN